MTVRHLPALNMAGLLLSERSGANRGILEASCDSASILTAQTSHQTSHSATARTSVELCQPELFTSRQRVTPRIPVGTDSYSFGRDGRSWGLPGDHCKNLPSLLHMHTHVLSLDFFLHCNGRTRNAFHAAPPSLHEYSFATVVSCDMLPWQGCRTTWPRCRRQREAVSERVTQARRVQLDPTAMVGFLNLRWIPDVPFEPPPFDLERGAAAACRVSAPCSTFQACFSNKNQPFWLRFHPA